MFSTIGFLQNLLIILWQISRQNFKTNIYEHNLFSNDYLKTDQLMLLFFPSTHNSHLVSDVKASQEISIEFQV